MSLLKSFARDRRGNVTAIFGVSLVPLLGLAGLAMDYSRGSTSRSDVQASADNAALAALIVQVPTIAQRESAGRAALSGNSGLVTTATFDITSLKATVTVESAVEPSFSKVLQVKAFKVAAKAVAERVFAGPPPCILALNTTAAKSILITGSAQYSALGCAIHANSNSGDALHIDNNTSVQASSFCAVGVSYVPTVLQPQARSYCEPLKDPFASLQAPAIGSCIATNLVVDPNQTRTLNPVPIAAAS